MATLPHSASQEPKDTSDHSTHAEFYNYYAKERLSGATVERSRRQADLKLSLLALRGKAGSLEVADIDCGASTLVMTRVELGYRVSGLDIDEPPIALARKQAAEIELDVDFCLGSATEIAWPESRTLGRCLIRARASGARRVLAGLSA